MFFMPRRAMVCEKVFQEEGIFGDVTLAEFPLDFIPFDSDILSLELDTAYKVIFIWLRCRGELLPLWRYGVMETCRHFTACPMRGE